MTALSLRGVVKRFGPVEVIHNVSFDIPAGEFVVFVGPSGCGKSTLLRMICGLETVSDGQVVVDDQVVNNVPPARRGLAMVFQSYALYPHMTVYQNMAFGLENIATPRAEIDRRVDEAARMLRLDQLLQRKPTQLSGGQRQRVAIGRAIVREPRIFLFDEPLSNLDAELRVSMRAEIASLHRRLGTTMIYVTHDQVEAMTMADRIVVLRSGAVEQVGPPLELYNCPTNQFVAGFIGSPRMNFYDGQIERITADGLVVTCPALGSVHTDATQSGRPGDSVTLGIRPEHVQQGDIGPNVVRGEVAAVEQLGGLSYVRLAAPDMTIQLAGQTGLALGHTAAVTLPPAAIHVFDGQGAALPLRAMAANRAPQPA